MSSDLADLYQEVVLDHGRKPRNFRRIPDATHRAEGLNPLCGDHFTVYAKLDGDVIRDLAFEGSGCAISKASASVMTGALRGKTIAEAEAIFDRFHAMVTQGLGGSVNPEELGKLAVFSGVWEFPTRVKCASLAWHALRAALRGDGQTVSTE